MIFTPTSLPEVLLITPDVFGDERGFFLELWREERYSTSGLPKKFVQDNLSFSRQGTLRGLHFQNPHPQGKLVSVLQGEVFDVAVDVRKGSPTFGKWVGIILDATKKQQLYVPEGFAHGFIVTSETAMFHYKCTEQYRPEMESVIRWDDPDLAIRWPIQEPTLSKRDSAAPFLRDLPSKVLDF